MIDVLTEIPNSALIMIFYAQKHDAIYLAKLDVIYHHFGIATQRSANSQKKLKSYAAFGCCAQRAIFFLAQFTTNEHM